MALGLIMLFVDMTWMIYFSGKLYGVVFPVVVAILSRSGWFGVLVLLWLGSRLVSRNPAGRERCGCEYQYALMGEGVFSCKQHADAVTRL